MRWKNSEMKIRVILVSMLLAVACTSCFVSSSKYEALQAERDSLALVAANVTTDFESSLQTINEIESALQTIREAENIIMIENQEGNSNYAVAQIEAIERTIQQNKAKIADLEQQLAESGSRSKQLNATITRLKNELNEKDTYINNLRADLEASQIQVATLTEQVNDLHQNVQDLNANIEDLNAFNAEQQATIRQQDSELNTVYYIAAPIETLVMEGLAEQGGLFSKDKVTNVIDKDVMFAVDKRDFRTLPLNSRKATILTNHPESSYRLTKDDEKNLSLEIINPEAFWNISNYLIISIK